MQDENGFQLIIERRLLDQLGGVNIDFRQTPWGGGGFSVRPNGGAGGACGPSCC